ncbi:hypothetical protein T4C_13994 [Trichinella pseudospiralis]|uniref:Uncharacterized protein n=1 Tax=Trichinella pseudospiralis TaxID=6337 RepID=A0A0V1H2D8_TRIPS|nr:hypothetical protein T4C_13994 [Trichinella pseudospiralis]
MLIGIDFFRFLYLYIDKVLCFGNFERELPRFFAINGL